MHQRILDIVVSRLSCCEYFIPHPEVGVVDGPMPPLCILTLPTLGGNDECRVQGQGTSIVVIAVQLGQRSFSKL